MLTDEQIQKTNEELSKGAPTTSWLAGDLIRNKRTGSPFFVVHVFSSVCTLIVSMHDTSENPDVRVLFERDYNYFAIDRDMRSKTKEDKNLDEDVKFKFDPIK